MYELETLDRYDQPALVTLRSLDRISAVIKRTLEENTHQGKKIVGYDYCALIGVEFFRITEETYNSLYETFLPDNQ